MLGPRISSQSFLSRHRQPWFRKEPGCASLPGENSFLSLQSGLYPDAAFQGLIAFHKGTEKREIGKWAHPFIANRVLRLDQAEPKALGFGRGLGRCSEGPLVLRSESLVSQWRNRVQQTLHDTACAPSMYTPACGFNVCSWKGWVSLSQKIFFQITCLTSLLTIPPTKSMLTRPFLIFLQNFPVNLSPLVLPTFSGNVSSGQLTSSQWPHVLWVGYFPCWALTWSKRPCVLCCHGVSRCDFCHKTQRSKRADVSASETN